MCFKGLLENGENWFISVLTRVLRKSLFPKSVREIAVIAALWRDKEKEEIKNYETMTVRLRKRNWERKVVKKTKRKRDGDRNKNNSAKDEEKEKEEEIDGKKGVAWTGWPQTILVQ